jgi:hypothetical protein
MFDGNKAERRGELVTHEDLFNQKIQNTNTTGFIGVSFMKNTGRYEAYILGEFAHLNFPLGELSG